MRTNFDNVKCQHRLLGMLVGYIFHRFALFCLNIHLLVIIVTVHCISVDGHVVGFVRMHGWRNEQY